jgi:F-type H+-transporting ATPase subunit epsilon
MNAAMQVRIMTPLEVVWEGDCARVSVQTSSGWWTLLPRHREMVAIVVPGIVSAWLPDGTEMLVATDGGILTKRGRDLSIATRRAAVGASEADLRTVVDRQFAEARKHEQAMQQVIGRLETDFIGSFARTGGYRET